MAEGRKFIVYEAVVLASKRQLNDQTIKEGNNTEQTC